MNKVIIMGRLTADPDLRTTQTGMSTCRFSVAVDRPFIDKTTGQRQADFIRCTAWDKSAENINRFFRKGSMIMIEGSLRTGSYQDKQYQDVTHYTTDVFVDRWEFCGSKLILLLMAEMLIPHRVITIRLLLSKLLRQFHSSLHRIMRICLTALTTISKKYSEIVISRFDR